MGGVWVPGIGTPDCPPNGVRSGRRSSTAKKSTFLAPDLAGFGGGVGGQVAGGHSPEMQAGLLGAWPWILASFRMQVPAGKPSWTAVTTSHDTHLGVSAQAAQQACAIWSGSPDTADLLNACCFGLPARPGRPAPWGIGRYTSMVKRDG